MGKHKRKSQTTNYKKALKSNKIKQSEQKIWSLKAQRLRETQNLKRDQTSL